MIGKLYEINVKRLIGWGGSISDAVLKAGEDLQPHVLERARAASLRKVGADFEDRVKYVYTESARILIDEPTGEEVIRFSPLQHNSYEDMKKTGKVVLSVQYATWDNKQ
ncbi:hypothetical protein bas12_0054 [Escherichia phage BrunoManser]|uniref:Uncharacterized protein n=1 Tax=Escherichia phage BrunoManser TaxID=2851976 RepID=A0AAE7VPN6_9CAUD|nr:hypothetical protein bas12_0054 [Escherichia phage BrunoManser]